MNVNKEYRRCKRAWKWQKFCEVWERRLERFFAWLNRSQGFTPGDCWIKMSPCFKADIKERIAKLKEPTDQNPTKE